MELRIVRLQQLTECTLGSLYLGDVWECFIREEPVRSDRVFVSGESALPVGRYNVSLTPCRRYGGLLPLLVSTQRGDGIQRAPIGMRIAPGRHVHSLYQGILVGQEGGPMTVHRTKPAFEALMLKLKEAVSRKEAIDCEIT